LVKICIISDNRTDISDILETCPSVEAVRYGMDETAKVDFSMFDGIALLPDSRNPMEFNNIFEAALNSGARVFSTLFRGVRGEKGFMEHSTRFERPVYVLEDGPDGLEPGDILEDQDNVRLDIPGFKYAKPILVYGNNLQSHSKAENHLEMAKNTSKAALWFENDRLMLCSFDIRNFKKARFSPLDKWDSLILYMFRWLADDSIQADMPRPYETGPGSVEECPEDSIKNAIGWFGKAGMLVDDGKGGVMEGLATEIFPDGTQKKAEVVRNDCCGEAMLAHFLKYLLDNDRKALEISDNLSDFIFGTFFTDKPGSPLDGMMMWSLDSPGICYQDDVARSVIPQMLKNLYGGTGRHMDKVSRALGFLVSTTGTDGLRVTRTENDKLDAGEVKRLQGTPGGLASAHYNAYYLASLLLNYMMTGNTSFLDTGVRGMESIMSAYPLTHRVLSETQELCRLVFPLALLYSATGKSRHRDMLYNVCSDLERFKQPSGAYVEWDTGYRAKYSRTNGDESSMLSENGDPVADLLYSVNWLPMGFIHAYFATGDEYFKSLWGQVCSFLCGCRIRSVDKQIDGAWARSWDLDKKEYFGIPNDVGWGPWCVESGWTVAEIVSGMATGLMADRLKEFFK
jgi:hypothetical protein